MPANNYIIMNLKSFIWTFRKYVRNSLESYVMMEIYPRLIEFAFYFISSHLKRFTDYTIMIFITFHL